MSRSIALFFFDFQACCIFLSFFVSLKFRKNDKIPGYMKDFFWYPIVAVVVLIPNILSSHFLKEIRSSVSIILNASLIFHFIFLSLFIYKVVLNKPIKIFLKTFFVLFLGLLFFLLFAYDIRKTNSLAFGITNFGLMVFSLLYYFSLLNNTTPVINLLKEPAFWIITGVFFSMSLHIPLFFSMDYLRDKISFENFRFLASGSTICFGIMHLFFIKAYLCAIHPQKA